VSEAPQNESFWAELKRRHVVRVAISYVVVGFVVLEAADILLPALNLPDWTITLVLALTLLGFPIALVLAWAFDVTPTGVHRTPPAHPVDRNSAPETLDDPAQAASQGSPDPPEQDDVGWGSSIAVLAFVDMSPEQDQGYFCEGISEEIIDGLTRVDGLEVAARSSAFAYNAGGHDLRQVGEELGVGVVLEGSVRKAGDTVRITAQLIKASDGYHLWSERYDRQLQDIFAIQEEIAQAVVDRMRSTLGEGAGVPVLRNHTADPEAYRLYLKGRDFWGKRHAVGLDKGLEYFNRALECDPDYALAHAGVADVYAVKGFYSVIPSDEAFEKATHAARRALELDDSLAEAHHAWGVILGWYTRDWQGCEASFRKSISLGANPAPYAWLCQMYGGHGRTDDLHDAANHVLRLDPRGSMALGVAAGGLGLGRQWEKCAAFADQALDVDPDFLLGLYPSGWSLVAMGRVDEGLERLERSVDLSQRNPLILSMYGATLGWAGRVEACEAVLAELEEQERSRVVQANGVAMVLAQLGRTDEALSRLEAYGDGPNPGAYTLGSFFLFDPLRGDERFDAILRRYGLPILDIEELERGG
jgi:adenylate cyclase